MTDLDGIRYRPIAVLVGMASVFVFADTHASNYEVELDISGVSAEALEQHAPDFPDGRMRAGQEGWVRIDFVIGPDGRVSDPVVVDSWGGPLFEQAALEAALVWRFEVPDAAMPRADNTVEVRFEITGKRDRASRDFLRRYRDIVKDLHYVNTKKAREKVNMANDFGGWNLYESTMLALLNARVEAAEDDAAEQLEYYRRALGVSDPATLDEDNRSKILARIFALEVDSGQYGDALATLAQLRATEGSDEALAELDKTIRQLESSIGNDDVLVATATIYSPCDCDTGKPLWVYTPARRDFSFAQVNGNVDSFEARCDNHRLSAQVETATRWSLPAEWGSCRIFVFGEDSATFEFVEHPGGEGFDSSTVASSDVVD